MKVKDLIPGDQILLFYESVGEYFGQEKDRDGNPTNHGLFLLERFIGWPFYQSEIDEQVVYGCYVPRFKLLQHSGYSLRMNQDVRLAFKVKENSQ